MELAMKLSYYMNDVVRDIDVPTLLKLTDNQIDDAKMMLAHKKLCVFNAAGTGKTLTALYAWRQSGAPRLLIVVPPIAVNNWIRWTLSMWNDAVVQVLNHGSARVLSDVNVVIVTYG
jgi:superfamily II DNA or RNA helicase